MAVVNDDKFMLHNYLQAVLCQSKHTNQKSRTEEVYMNKKRVKTSLSFGDAPQPSPGPQVPEISNVIIRGARIVGSTTEGGAVVLPTCEGKTGSFTAVKGRIYNFPVTAPATVTCPLSPAFMDSFVLRLDGASETNIITINGNGENVESKTVNGTLIRSGTHLIEYWGEVDGVNVGWVSYAGLRT